MKKAIVIVTVILMLSASPAFAAKDTPASEITIMFTGDLMCQPSQQIAAYNGKEYNFKSTFKYVKKIFATSDFVVGNLETLVSKSLPLSRNMKFLQRKPYLNAPDAYLDSLKYAGFDALVLANNHVCDGGEIGITETLKAIDEKGFSRTGLFRNSKEKRYIILEKDGIKVVILSYATYFNEKEKFIPAAKRGIMLNPTVRSKIKADVKALKAEGADYIVAYNHCGTEFSQKATTRQKNYGLMLAKAGVDYVIGSHPHVLQPYTLIKEKGLEPTPYIYSIGNFASAMVDPITKETIILSLTLKKTKTGDVTLAEQRYYPCYVLDEYEGASFVIMPEDRRYNDGFYDKAPKALVKEINKNFKHIHSIIGELRN